MTMATLSLVHGSEQGWNSEYPQRQRQAPRDDGSFLRRSELKNGKMPLREVESTLMRSIAKKPQSEHVVSHGE
jgi:hypothetical protein